MKCKVCLKEFEKNLKIIGEGGNSVETISEIFILELDRNNNFNIYGWENNNLSIEKLDKKIQKEFSEQKSIVVEYLCSDCAKELTEYIKKLNKYIDNTNAACNLLTQIKTLNEKLNEISEDSNVKDYSKTNLNIIKNLIEMHENVLKDDKILFNSVNCKMNKMAEKANENI